MSGGAALSPPISVVVPVKDEAGNVGPLAREIAAALAGESHEILFVDDGSSDGTAAALMALKSEIPQLRVLRHGRNLGQSRGIRSGVAAARGDIIVTLDGDGQNDPADIPKLLAVLRGEPQAAMVSGVRVKRKDTASRRLASRLGNGLSQHAPGRWRRRHRLRAEGVPARGVSGPALFRSHPPLPDRAGAARRLERSRMCR